MIFPFVYILNFLFEASTQVHINIIMMILYYDYCFQASLLFTAYFQKWDHKKIIPSAQYLYTIKNVCFTRTRVLCLSAPFGVWRITPSFSYRHSSFVTFLCFRSTISFCSQATPSVGFRREENTAGNCTICTLRLVRRDVPRVSTYL